MKAIIAEKPSVGMDIARVVGATEKKGRLLYRQRVYGHVGVGAPRVTGIARHIRLHEDSSRRPPVDSRTFPTGRQANKDGQRYGDRHNRQQTAQDH